MAIEETNSGEDVITAGWSIFEDEQNQNYYMAYRTFAVQDKSGPREAGSFLENYILRYKLKQIG